MGTIASFTPCTDIEPFLDGDPKALLSLYPSELVFGNTVLGETSGEQTVLLKNDGSDDVAITGITAVGDFTVTSEAIASIDAGETLAITLTFSPERAGEVTGGLHIASVDASGNKFVKLKGTGVLAPAAVPEFYALIGTNNSAFDAVNVDEGVYGLIATGTFDGASVQLQWRADDETAWADIAGAVVNGDAPAIYAIPLTSCQVRVVISGGGSSTSLAAKLIW